jgi:toxin HigB-1
MVTQVIITRAARKGLENAPPHVRDKFGIWVKTVRLFGLEIARSSPSLHDEALQGQRQGQRSIRLNKQWRAVYIQTPANTLLVTVLEVTAHDYRTR